jgi:DNA (cytosine-5)-methyltransferase 1
MAIKSSFIMSISKPLALDIFCGCGGLTVGLKRAGFKVIGAIDIDPISIKTYKSNHPEVKTWSKDVSRMTISAIKKRLNLRKGELDLLAGCPPCQGFSTLRTLNGSRKIDDIRNDLLFEFQRLTEGLLPKTVMLENVPALARDERFVKFYKTLDLLGYKGTYRIIDTGDYGVAQRRRRLIYLAGLGRSIPFAKPSKKKRTVYDVIGKMPQAGKSGDFIHDIPQRHTKKVMDLIKRIPKDGGSRTDLPKEDQLECHKRCNGFKDIYGRMAWGKLAPTITCGCFNPSKGRFLHPEEDRAITMREAALLQGLPRRYQFNGTKSKTTIALMIGNALPPPFIRRHAFQIKKVITSL